MPNLGATEIIIILIVIVVLFGAKKLPDAARSLGRSMRIFRSEVKEMKNDDQQEISAQSAPEQLPQPNQNPGENVQVVENQEPRNQQ
ncbi:Sec-independent protein translocase subunit TatA [Corynebacterium renale]|uniref:Sec-independent protein translocase subunit TatA n=1 Tax=Corynebacterium renale TaxID=1724 RepID=UPI000DFDDAE3|nr:Sec-independent protein translocase subunit TatA [Corynebacterium renale]STC95894.1 sec-independent protein translocase [Corynebacterium renale]